MRDLVRSLAFFRLPDIWVGSHRAKAAKSSHPQSERAKVVKKHARQKKRDFSAPCSRGAAAAAAVVVAVAAAAVLALAAAVAVVTAAADDDDDDDDDVARVGPFLVPQLHVDPTSSLRCLSPRSHWPRPPAAPGHWRRPTPSPPTEQTLGKSFSTKSPLLIYDYENWLHARFLTSLHDASLQSYSLGKGGE